MTQTLQQLSAAATQGAFEAQAPDVENDFGVPIIATNYPGTYGPSNGLVLWATMLPTEIDDKDTRRAQANATFITALVNAYRAGQLVEVQAEQCPSPEGCGYCKEHGCPRFEVKADDATERVASALSNAPVGHTFPDGSQQTFTDALCDGINFNPNDDSAATIYETVRSLAATVIAAMKGPKP